MVTFTIRQSELLSEKDSSLPYPRLEINIFYFYTDIIKSQYHSDAVVPVLHTVTVKCEHGSYISKNFERPHYVPLNKKIFDRIGINAGYEAGDLVDFEHSEVTITLLCRCSKKQYFI